MFAGNGVRAETVEDLPQALARACRLAGHQGEVVIAGSIFLLGDALRVLRGGKGDCLDQDVIEMPVLPTETGRPDGDRAAVFGGLIGRYTPPRRRAPMRLSHHFGLTLREAPARNRSREPSAAAPRRLHQAARPGPLFLPAARAPIDYPDREHPAGGNEPDRRPGDDHASRSPGRDLAPVGTLRRRRAGDGALQGPQEQRSRSRHDARRGGGRPLPERDSAPTGSFPSSSTTSRPSSGTIPGPGRD